MPRLRRMALVEPPLPHLHDPRRPEGPHPVPDISTPLPDEAPAFVTAKRVDGDAMIKAQKFAAERYIAGDSLRTIATFTGWSYGKTHRMVVLSGTPLRPRGGYNR